jgi:hypothetical protein
MKKIDGDWKIISLHYSETCTAKWYAGERMDWDLAVGNLFS